MSVLMTSADGDKYSRTASCFDYDANYTVSMWVKANPVTAVQRLYRVYGDSNNYFDFLTFTAAARLQVEIFGPTGTGGNALTPDENPYSNNTWYFIACRRVSATSFQCYTSRIDGVDADVSSTDPSARAASDNFCIGGDSGVAQFNGKIAQVRIWQTDLTNGELALEKASSTVVKTANLWANYPMVDAATAATDISGNSRDLTASGSPADGNEDPPGQSGPAALMWL